MPPAPRGPGSPAVAPPLPRSVQILAFGTLALIATLAFLAFSRETTPIAESGISPSTAAERPSAAASPLVVRFPSELVIVTHTPEATPEPTPTYTMLPTPRPPAVCLTSTPRGSVCTQPEPPLPTSTPMADCPVLPGDLCVWRGGPVRQVSPTPTFGPGMGN